MILKRNNPLDRCLLKFASDDKGEFEGYASTFNNTDEVGDTIHPGAFQKSLESGRTPKMFVNHDHSDIPVGSWVDLKEDDTGLRGTGQINMDHHLGPALYSAMKRDDMDALSIGFTMSADNFKRKDDQGRDIYSLDLKEISVVTFPCDDAARIVGVKADDMLVLQSLKDCEDYLRESCLLSRSVAVAFVSHVKKLARGEPAVIDDKSQSIDAVTDRILTLIG